MRSHSRLWDPTRTHINTSADAVGYPAMYLTLHINWDKYKPLWSRTPLPAAAYLPATTKTARTSSTPNSSSSSSSSSGVVTVDAPSPDLFTPPVSLNSPTPESIKIISKPSLQRWMGLQELLSKRAQTRPGIFLLSTHQGLLTDIDCELRGIGGTVLAHLGLPMGQVVQLRGLLRAKYMAELAAALPPAEADVESAVDGKKSSSSSRRRALEIARHRAQHVPLARWDARAQAAQGLSDRVVAANSQGNQYLHHIDTLLREGGDMPYVGGAGGTEQQTALSSHAAQKLLHQARRLLLDLQVQETAWSRHGGGSSSSQDSSSTVTGGSSSGSGDGGGSRRDIGRRGGRGGRSSSSSRQDARQSDGQQQQQLQRLSSDRWQPEAAASTPSNQ